MKKITVLLILVCSCFLLFSNDLSQKFEKAKRYYQNRRYDDSLNMLYDLENELKSLKIQDDNKVVKSVSIENMLQFTEEYFKRDSKYKIENVIINTSKTSKNDSFYNNLYSVEVLNKDKTVSSGVEGESGKDLIFYIDFSLLEKLIENIGSNRNAYVNIYSYGVGKVQRTSFLLKETYYYIEINKIELLSESDGSVLEIIE